MSSLYRQFQANGDLEKKGVLLEYGMNNAGLPITIRIARAGGSNDRFVKRMEAKVKPFRRQIQTETMDGELAKRLVREVYAETVVLGWENVEDKDGNPLDFSVANAIALFTDLPDLFADVQEQAGRAALFREQNLEAEAGN